MAEIFERARLDKYVVYVGTEHPPEGEEQEAPPGRLMGTAATTEAAALLVEQYPDGVLYERQTVQRFVPV